MVASRTTTGGSGFVALLHRGQRLAYLQILRNNPPATASPPVQPIGPNTPLTIGAPVGGGFLELSFYDIWNKQVWLDLFSQSRYRGVPAIVILQRLLDSGELELKKVIKSPTGLMREIVFDLRGTKITELTGQGGQVAEQITLSGHTFGKTIRITPHPYPSHMTGPGTTASSAPQYSASGSSYGSPAPATKGGAFESFIPDVLVGRKALRTFNLVNGTLDSLFKGSNTWNGGTAVAECRSSSPCPEAPGENCRCGLYGTLTLQHLVSQYSKQTRFCVAVFAAEGTSYVGDDALRTHAARLLGYWCATGTEKAIFDTHAPEAVHFETVEKMLAKYGFPEYQVGSGYGGLFEFPAYDPVERPVPEPIAIRPPQPKPDPPRPRRQSPDAVAKLAALLPAATPAGLAAIGGLVGTDLATVQAMIATANSAVPNVTSAPLVPPDSLRCGVCTLPVTRGCVCPSNPYRKV